MSFDFEKATSLDEAIFLYNDYKQKNYHPLFYNGGTEIISLGRLNIYDPNVVIDIKRIPEMRQKEIVAGYLHLGASLTLTDIGQQKYFPLLSATAKDIADRTARNSITLGGNICGKIFYKEALLPFMLTDSELAVISEEGLRLHSIHDFAYGEWNWQENHLFVYVKTKAEYLQVPFVHIKKRKQWKTGYPLLTITACKIENQIRISISGLYRFPFRAFEIESFLNNLSLSLTERIDRAISSLKGDILTDVEGSRDYRLFVLKNSLMDIVTSLEGRN